MQSARQAVCGVAFAFDCRPVFLIVNRDERPAGLPTRLVRHDEATDIFTVGYLKNRRAEQNKSRGEVFASHSGDY
jgi:hypothetical protein